MSNFRRRKGKKNRHHMQPKSRGGNNNESNILILDVRRHEAWHLLFGNKTFAEAIRLLERTARMKEAR